MNAFQSIKKTKVIAVILFLTSILVFFYLNRGYSMEELEAGSKRDFEELQERYFAGTSTGEYLRTRFQDRGKLWKAASKAGIPEGEFIQAECLRKGIPDLIDKQSAFVLYESAASSGLPWAILRVGYCHYNGYGTPQSVTKGIEWIQKADNLNYLPATRYLGSHFLSWAEPREHKLGEKLLRNAFDGGFNPAAYYLGRMYEFGEGTPQNIAKAIEWYQIASDGGSYSASAQLSYLYDGSDKLPEDLVKGHAYIVLAAEQGNGDAAFGLTNRFQNGYKNHVSPDPEKALFWCRKAAIDLGNAEAMSELGYYYDTGFGVEIDKKRARYWYKRAADRGSAWGTFNLAHCHLDGEGGRKDPSKGVELMQKAAEMKHPRALNSLGVLYIEGEHVDRDQDKAVELWTEAARLGNEDAKKNLHTFRNH